MKITDEITFAAVRGFSKRPGYSQLERMRDALEAVLPHLTDDGAAAPPADSTGVAAPSAAVRATSTAAPSSPHLRTALEKLVQQWQYSDGKGFRGFYEAVESLLAAYPIGAATPFELEFELISWHRKEGYEAGLAARGATPTIDREAVEDEVREALEDLCITAYPTSAKNDADDPIGIETVVGHVAGYILALLRGEAQ